MCLAVPGKIVSIENPGGPLATGKVDFAGVVRQISLALVPEAQVGAYVIVHAGCALNELDEAEALQVLEDFRILEELQPIEKDRMNEGIDW